jgi:mono/diheme cytochrome c family protein
MDTAMPSPIRRHLGAAVCAVGMLLYPLGAAVASGQAPEPAPPSTAAVHFFETKVRPILADHCFKCHGSTKQKSDLRLDSAEAVLGGGNRGPALVPGHPEQSLLVKAIGYGDADLKMPPTKKLTPQQIADLTEWVQIGAPWPASDKTTTTPRRGEFQITAKDRAHWAFQPVQRPTVPAVKNRAWVANPIDAFVLAKLEARGLQPNPPAAKGELIRRAYYDLTGLPPTPAEVEAFQADPSPRAYEDLIDRLLDSPRYGEQWGRHWLDLVRFAETNSYERDGPKPHAWRYRDYVIRAYNQDKPYDQFVREQLAGDELPKPDADALIATGYYRLGIWDDEPTDREQARYDGLDDIVATTGQVFLGLTFDCARCHDHKIDPVPQKDYYRLLAFFHNINHYHNGGPTDEVPLVREPKAKKPGPAEMALCVTEAGSRAPETFVLLRGNPHVKGDKVEPAFPLIFEGPAPVIPQPPAGAKTSGRRLILANWITARDNALTARVMANRIWQYHFGRGIVRSASNFGLQGDAPTHPELLDWLAVEFIHHDWRMKPLHRLIMTSNAYRMSSRGNPAALSADPANDLFWRFDMRRLSAEEIRDSILAVTGTLNPKMYGPGVYVDIPREVLAGQSMPGNGWGKSPPAEQARRSVYIHVKRSLLTPILERFDVAETDRSSPVRFTTTQPTQALLMLNSDFLDKQADVFARRLRREAGTDVNRQVGLALRLATTRPPGAAEVRRGVQLIEALQSQDGATGDAALKYFCLLVLNLNEFVYLD